jgi:hypothetical protein
MMKKTEEIVIGGGLIAATYVLTNEPTEVHIATPAAPAPHAEIAKPALALTPQFPK